MSEIDFGSIEYFNLLTLGLGSSMLIYYSTAMHSGWKKIMNRPSF